MIVDNVVQQILTHPVIVIYLGITSMVVTYIVYSSTPALVPDLPGPRGWPLVGSLFFRGIDPADTFQKWVAIYGPVFRLRLGNQWIVVVNGADAADELMASPQFATSTLSRPQGWSFSKFIDDDPRSITVGSSPPGPVQRSKRLLAIEACQPAILRKYDQCIERVCKHMVRAIYTEMQSHSGVVDPFSIHFGCTIEEAECTFNSRNSMQPLN
jgi:cytochrome P450